MSAREAAQVSGNNGDLATCCDALIFVFDLFRFSGAFQKVRTSFSPGLPVSLTDSTDIQAGDMLAQLIPMLAKVKPPHVVHNLRNSARYFQAGRPEPLVRPVLERDGYFYELDHLSSVENIVDAPFSVSLVRNRARNPYVVRLVHVTRNLAASAQFQEARDILLRASELDRFDPVPYYERGYVEIYLRDYRSALASFAGAHARAPHWFHVSSNLLLARLLMESMIDHDTFVAYHMLEDVQMGPQQKYHIAKHCLNKLELPIGCYHVAMALFDAGKVDSCLETLQLALSRPYLDNDIRTRILFQLGSLSTDCSEREQYFEQAIACGGNLTAKRWRFSLAIGTK